MIEFILGLIGVIVMGVLIGLFAYCALKYGWFHRDDK